jgi:hypothetical protein
MKSYVSAAWSAENRRQVRSVQLYRWLDNMQALALEMLHETNTDIFREIGDQGLSIANIEAHMSEDCFPALFLWHLLQIRATFEQAHVTDAGAALSRLFDLITGRLCIEDDTGRRLKQFFSSKALPGGISPLYPRN